MIDRCVSTDTAMLNRIILDEKEPIVLQGPLKKQSTRMLLGWQWRYFILQDKKLFYFHQKPKNGLEQERPRFIINFDFVHCSTND
jgi:hypothetical protein